MKIQPGTFAKHAAETDSVLDYARALNPFAVAMEAPAGERVSRQLGGWARGLGGGALGGLLGGFGGRELGAAAGAAVDPELINQTLGQPGLMERIGAFMASDQAARSNIGEGLMGHAFDQALQDSAGMQLPSGARSWLDSLVGSAIKAPNATEAMVPRAYGGIGPSGFGSIAAGSLAGAAGGAAGLAGLGGLRGHVSAIRSARAARRAQEAAERSARAMADLEAAKRVGGGALGDMGERAVGALKRNPLLAGLGAGALGAYAMS